MLTNLLTQAISQLLNDALHAELNAFYLYRNLSNQCHRLGYFGAAKFFKAESESESEHANRIEEYFNDRGSVAKLPELPETSDTVDSLEQALTLAYQTELDLNKSYSTWYAQALTKDPTTAQFLLQFIEIQRHSVGEYADWLQRLSRVSDDSCGILLIDKELGEA
jgi:ferritin